MLNQPIFNAINGLAEASSALDWTGIIITTFGVPLLGLLILFTRKQSVVLKGLVSFLIAKAIELGIKAVWHVPRPTTANILVTTTNFSFPSGHSAGAFALAMTLYFYNKKIGIPALIFAALIGISRIFVGAHWPSDVAAGIIIGIGVAYAVDKLLGKDKNKKKSRKNK
jgi:undecaprenyl-diphosphatase